MKEQDAAHSFDNNSNVTEMRTWLIHNKIELDGEFYVRFADALHAVSQFKIMKDEPPLEKGIDIVCQHCESKKAIHYANDKYFCSGCFAKEYTRLRSELQQERDKVRNQAIQDCIDILVDDIKIPVTSSWLEKLEQLKTKQ